jgi:3-phosphoshikimate 1-carboxyvinyltransferase
VANGSCLNPGLAPALDSWPAWQAERAMYDIEYLDIPPLIGACGTVRLPGSKSISNRVLLLAGLSAGTTVVHDLLDSDDTRVMLDALRLLGCAVNSQGSGSWHITGLGGQLKAHQADLFLGNAGTAMRPLTAALAVLAATQGGEFTLRGVARMHERPIGDLVDALRALGCAVECAGTPGYPPLLLRGNAGGQLILGTPIPVRGDVSSQFLTSLLMALPLVSRDQAITIEVQGELISKPYIDITLKLLARFGIGVENHAFGRFVIPQNSQYSTPGSLHVEGDASSASYFIAVGALATTDAAPIRIEGVGLDSIQGDIRFIEAAAAMGAHIRGGAGHLLVSRGHWPLRGITLDCNHIPDAAMTLACMALFADSPTLLTNIGSWRVKETDRLTAMATELRKVGASVEEGPDFLRITPPAQWHQAAIHTYDDHRMAMCLALAAFNPLAGSHPPAAVRILDPRCVGKTFPEFFETLFGVVAVKPDTVPVITIDGPTASGKGTLAAAVAHALGFELLDSGSLYRATALAAMRDGVPADDEAHLARLASLLDLRFEPARIWMRGQDVTETLRDEAVGNLASQISAYPGVREALHGLQLSFRQAPGLVADGRDMGTVVFPGAELKVFLTASADERAKRRHKQLISKGFQANIDGLRADLLARDERDKSRTVAPLKPAQDAMLLDNSHMTIEESMKQVLGWWRQRRAFA